MGVVETQYHTIAGQGDELSLESGEKLGPVTLAYETYGNLNADKSNGDSCFACAFRRCPCGGIILKITVWAGGMT